MHKYERSLSCTFSRHDKAQASLALFIWLNENVGIIEATGSAKRDLHAKPTASRLGGAAVGRCTKNSLFREAGLTHPIYND